MKTYKGKCINVVDLIIGRISAKHEKNYVLRLTSGEAFIICAQPINVTNYVICKDFEAEIGDIVAISPTGNIIKLYEEASNDNALFFTEKCNNNCIMCPQILTKSKYNYFEENMQIIDLLTNEPSCIGITGGEPTCEWNNLLSLVSKITEKFPNTIIQLLTNGRTFKNRNKVEEISSISDHILYCIPLYSEIERIHTNMVGNNLAYSETIDGLYNLAQFKQTIELRTVITKMNFMRLPQYAEWVCKNLPFLSHVALMGMEPLNKVLNNFDDLWIDSFDYKDELYKAIKIFQRNDMPAFIYNHQLCVVDERIREICCKSISDFKVVYLDKCNDCVLKDKCGGLFNSAKIYHSRKIQAVKD